MRRHSRLVPAALALLCAFTVGAGVSVVRLLPGRLELWQPPRIAAGKLAGADQVLGTASGQPSGLAATAAGVSTAIGPVLSSPDFGPQLGVLVTDLSTGQVLYSRAASSGFTPASTTKLATSVAALQVLGPAATFSTKVETGATAADIVLVGGGDPTLAAGTPPATDYPQPATLLQLAARTAQALRASGRHSVHLGYDTSLYTGPGLAASWAPDYVSTGNVSVITPLEADQGRLTARGAPEDIDEADLRPRAADPAAQAAAVFARYLRADGISVPGAVTQTTAAAGAATLASVQSPPLSEVVQWMLEESNNVIAENLARQVAIATGQPASFTGAAAAVLSVLHGLGVTGTMRLDDGSGLSPDNKIAPAVLVQLIGLAATHSRLRPVLTGLPVAHFSGTLVDGGSVFGSGGSAARGVVRAKTGNLSTAAALAGIAYARNGQQLAFAVMAGKIPVRTGLVAAATQMVSLATVLAGCGCR